MRPILSNKQYEFWRNANHRWNIKTGATRSGKTYMDYFLLPRRILAGHGKEGLNVILGNTRNTIKRNLIVPLQTMYGIRRVSDIRSDDNSCMMFGEKVYCLGADNANHVDRLRGTSIKYCYGDEIVTWNQDVFDMLKSRLDKPYSLFDGTCNPDAPTHWFHEFLESDADIYQQAYRLDDNPYLSPEFVENLKKEYSGTVLYDRYIEGLWVAAEGALFTTYPHYTDDASKLYNGIAHVDAAFGGDDYTAFVCAKKRGDTIYMYGRLWRKHVDTVMNAITEDCRRLMCAPLYLETNADKGYVGREFQKKNIEVRMYHEHENKFMKISTYLRKYWNNIVFLDGTDKAFIGQILSYTLEAEHDDAPDSAATICRIFDNLYR